MGVFFSAQSTDELAEQLTLARESWHSYQMKLQKQSSLGLS